MRSGRRRYGAEHRRLREALLSQVVWGATPCCLCGHPLEPGDQAQLDHHDQGGDGDYRGLAHASPCRVCGRRCNQAKGGELAALLAGKRLRTRPCTVCGVPFTASHSADGAKAATCGRPACVTALKRARRRGDPDPEPPPATGRRW